MNPTSVIRRTRQSRHAIVRWSVVLGTLLSLVGTAHSGAASTHIEKTSTASASATPIVGGTSYGSAVAIAPDIEYSGVLTTTHKEDYFYVDVNPGAAITIAIASTTQYNSTGYFYLYDQAHVNFLTYVTVAGPEQTGQLVYRGNSTTPTRYYFRAQITSSSLTAYNAYTFTMRIVDQADAGQAYDAGDTGLTARVITPTLNAVTIYTGTTGGLDNNDYFRIAAVPGQIISASMQIIDFGPTANVHYGYIYDAANTSNFIRYETLTAGNFTPIILQHMANGAAPTAYLLRMERSGTTAANNSMYRITIQSTQQDDAAVTGDAGENFDAARVITPNLSAAGRLGFADDIDFYQVDLPIGTITADTRPFKFVISPVAWQPGATGYMRIDVYNANRSPKGSPLYIDAPTIDPLSIDLTNCDLCYIKISDFSNKPFQYQFELLAPKQVFVPAVRK